MEFCTQKMKANKTMKGQAIPNQRRRKGKKVESNIDSATHNQILINKDNYMTGITTYLLILTLNVNGLNSHIKRHSLANWIKKEDPTIFCLQETHLIDRNKHWLRVKGWKKIYQASGPQKQAEVAILNLEKVDFKLTQCQCTQFHRTYSEGSKNIYKLQHSGSGRP
jgi:hypothetical protein